MVIDRWSKEHIISIVELYLHQRCCYTGYNKATLWADFISIEGDYCRKSVIGEVIKDINEHFNISIPLDVKNLSTNYVSDVVAKLIPTNIIFDSEKFSLPCSNYDMARDIVFLVESIYRGDITCHIEISQDLKDIVHTHVGRWKEEGK